MKKVLLLAVTMGFFAGCEENVEETGPIATACFNSPETDYYTGEVVSFSNCSENATSYAWDFGDGEISTEKNPSHIYQQGGTYTIKLVVGNETSVDTVSKNIAVINLNADNFTFGDQTYTLGKGYITSHSSWETDESGRIHSLVFTESENSYIVSDEYHKGEGIIVGLTLIGKGRYDIIGDYKFSNGASSWPDPSDVRTVSDMTVLSGAYIYEDLDDSTEEGWNNSTEIYEDDYNTFSLKVEKSGEIYTITISGTASNGKVISLKYVGELEKY